MKTPEEIYVELRGKNRLPVNPYDAIKMAQLEAWNEATALAAESATAYLSQESVNGGKVAKVNKESILKNLKK